MKRTPLQAADLKLSRRLLMVALTGTLPLFVVALLLLTWSYRGKIDFILQERRGIAFELPLEQLLEAVPHYQAAARRSLAGDGSAARERADLARQIDALVATISTNYNGDPGQTLGFTDAKLALRNRDAARLSVLLDAWTQLRGAPPAGSALDRAASQLIESVRTMIVHDGDLSNLILDDNLDSYYLMHLTLCALPPAQQRLGEITLQVGGWLRDGLAGANQAQVTLQAELIQQVDQKVIVDDTQTALIEHGSRPTAGPTMEQNMRPALAAYTTANGRFLALLDRVAAGDAVPAADLEAAGWTTRAASFQLGQVGADELDRLLAGRLWSIQAQRLRSDCLLGLTLLAAAGVMGWIIRGLLQTRYAEMRRTEEELRNSAEKFLKAFQANPSGIAITEMETGRYLDVNESFGRLYGHTREEMVGHTSLEMGIWGRSNERDRLIHRLLADGRVRDLEMHTHTRHGSPRTVMVNAELIELDGRRCVVSLIHDITERKCAEDALRASENRFKEVERAVNDGIWERNLGTRTAYISPRWKAILGYTDAELPNPDAAFFDHIHPDDRDAVDEAIRCHLEEKTRFVIEFRLRHKDGSHRWVRSRGEAIRDASGRPLRMVGAITDITDDKRAAEALLASEKQYRQLVESSLEAITVHRDWTIVYVNPAAARMFGANAMPQLVGKPILDLVHREFHALARMRHASVLAQGSGGPMVEMRLLRLDGTEIEVEVQSVRVLFEGEAATQITARDVTQRKQAQKNASQLAALVAFSDDAIIGKDLNGIITSWNQGAEKIYGYTAGEMVGAAGTRLIPAAAHGEEKLLLETVRRGECVRNLETMRKGRDGQTIDVSITASPVRDAEGRVVGVSVVARVITERKRAEASLRESEERFRRLFETESDAIVMLDQDTSRVLDANPAALQLYGYSHGEIVGLRSEELSAEPAQTRETIARRVAKVPLRLHRRKDGTSVPVEINNNFFEVQGRRLHVATVRDLTEQRRSEASIKRLQAQLQQAQKLEAIGTLSAGIAHDFNNILAGIYGYTSLAQRAAAGQAELSGYLHEITRAGHRATQLVRQILAFSRVRAADETMELVALDHVVAEAIKLLRATSPSTIRLTSNLGPDLHLPPVLGSATQLHQVVMNLGTNAIQAMADRPGRLNVTLFFHPVDEAHAQTLPELHPGAHVRLTVSDTGPGMDGPTQERVFEPFFTTKGPGQGTGLGLSVVHGIVHRHHGAVRLTSEPDCGTTVEVYLPAAIGSSARVTAAVEPVPDGRGERILLVDDEEQLVRSGVLILRQLGYTVEGECRALAALAQFERDPQAFQMVITDQTMPDLTGLELARRIHALRPGLPVVITTGYSSTLTPERLQEAGVREVLAKPYTVQLLAETVQRHLAGR